MKILAFDIGGTEIKYGLLDGDYNFIEKKKIPSQAEMGGRKIIDNLIEIAKTYEDIDCIGISSAGQINNVTGEVVYSTGNIPDYTGTKIKEIVEKETGLKTYVDNDVNAAAIGEYVFGAAKGEDNFICLTYGTGVGGSIFIDGKPFTGSRFSAGELGHIITHANGYSCTCGGQGCYEAYASTKALVKRVEKVINKSTNGIEIFKNFDNPIIKKEIDLWIDEIVLGLKSIIYIFNPSLIVLGGGIMNEKYIIDSINERLISQLMDNFKNVKVVKAKNGNDAAKLGVAYMACKQ